MKKEEISKIMRQLWSGVDQADLMDSALDLMCSAPVSAQQKFMMDIIDNPSSHEDMDEEVLQVAKRIVGYEDEE